MMDTLSRLLSLYPVGVALDYRCQFGAPWRLDTVAASVGAAPYHIVTEGSAWLDTPEQSGIRLETGDIIVLPHGSSHSLWIGGEGHTTPAEIIEDPLQPVQLVVNEGRGPRSELLCGEFHFDPVISGGFFQALPPLMHVRSAQSSDVADILALISMLRREAQGPRLGSTTLVAQLASALFAMILRVWIEQAGEPGLFGLLADPRLRNALQAMLAEPAHPWSVEELAKACHLSRATFARKFLKAAGATPGDVLLRMRMAHAAQWLRKDTRSISAIAEAAGYQSEAAFSRAFTRTYGVAPGSFRKRQL